MKMRPQFNLRFRDADQFLDIKFLADEADIPVNEWILRQVEKVPLLLGARLAAKEFGLPELESGPRVVVNKKGNETATGVERMRGQVEAQSGGVGVLDVEEPVVRPKAQAASGRVGGSGGGKRVATGEEPDGGRGCVLCGGLNGVHQKGCKGR